MPSPLGPFLSADLGGGRSLVGEGGRLTYRAADAVPPLIVELIQLRALTLESRPFFEALVLCGFAVVGFVAVGLPLKLVMFGLAALGGLLAAVCRVHALVLETSTGGRLRWPLGLARRGSERDARLLGAWSTLAGAVKARGVVVRDASGAVLTAPSSEPPEGPRA
ncbi:hypothetical protein [Myxococcus sp. CA040A]|uniref:hypothetical protein n=1 Tax=Myxococcus sp. CA040A TaxID=2741738 RepID=UPI0020C66B74